MNDVECASFQFFKLKYNRRDQIIQPYCRIGSPHEIRSPSLIWENFKNLSAALSCIMHWNLMNYKEFQSFNIQNRYAEGKTK